MRKQCLFIVSFLLCFVAATAFAGDGVQLTVSPKVLDIGTFYNGSTLAVQGTVPAESEAVVRFVGESCDLHLKERGKVFGIMWMNLDTLTLKDVPNVCIVSSAEKLDDSAGDAEGSAVNSLGLSGIKKGAKVESKGLGRDEAFKEFLKLKRKEGLYREITGKISYDQTTDGLKHFKTEIPVPSRLAPGKYLVELVAVGKGKVIGRAEEPVIVDLVGFPAMLSGLAFGHSALYGILATLIALVAGLVIGLVFQSKGAH